MAKAAKKGAAKAPASKTPSLKLTEFTASSIAAATAAAGAKKSAKLLLVPVENIKVVPGFNLRVTDTATYKAGIEELKQSILLEGYYESKPLSCFAAEVDDEPAIVLIDGHRRYQAVLDAIADGKDDLEFLPVVLKAPTSSDLDLAVSLQKENASVALTILERAVLAHRMLRAGESVEDTAARLNVTPRHVNDLKLIIGAPKAVRDLIKEDKVSASEAITQLRKDPTGEKILAAAEKAEERAAEKAKAGEKAKDSKLTKQTIEGGGVPKVKMQRFVTNFSATAGAEFLFEDVEPFLGVIGDEDWFKNARAKSKRIALEDITVECIVRRPKPEEEQAEETPAPETKAAAPRKGNGRKAPAVVDDDDLMDDDDDLGGTPDLKALGIAEPVGADL